MRTNTSLRVKLLIAYIYYLCARSDLCVRVHICAWINLVRMYTTCVLEETYAYEYSFARKATYYSTAFLTSWRDDDSRADARWFVQRCDDRRWMLDDSVTVLIGCPVGSVWRMHSSGIFSSRILHSVWAVLVVIPSGFRHNLLCRNFRCALYVIIKEPNIADL